MTTPDDFLPAILPIDELLLADTTDALVETATDTGNGERFTRLFHGHVRYAQDSDQWYLWDGQRLVPDPGRRVFGLTQHVITDIRRQANQAEADGETAERDRWVAFAQRSSSVTSRRAMMYDAGSRPPVAIVTRQLDADPWLLGVRNGVLELQTGRLRDGTVGDLITRQAATWYDPDADCPLWRRHVQRVTDNDDDLVEYLRRIAGYALTGDVSRQQFWFLFGSGQNGKNVLADTLRGLMGEYGQVAPPGLITGGSGQHPTILADLRGARLIIVDETGREKINDARVKMMTGSNRIKARVMKGDFFEFENTFKLWVLGNTKPQVTDATDGIWRRLRLVPFDVRIPDEERILNLTSLLEAEWPGILNWALEGLWHSLEDGLESPKRVAGASEEYREDEDLVGRWLEDRCEVRIGEVDELGYEIFEEFGALYQSYVMWSAREGIAVKDTPTKRAFMQEPSLKRFKRDKISVDGRKVNVRYGVKLRALS